MIGTSGEPFRREYIVGPLPATKATTVEPLQFPFNNQKKGESKYPSLYTASGNDTAEWFTALSEEVADITEFFYNTVSKCASNP
jgi:primary-amine oxidase